VSVERDGRAAAALAVADALVTSPARIDEGLRARVHVALDGAELVEVLLDTLAWSQQKVMVALGVDAPVDPAGPTPLSFDGEGHALVGGGDWQRRV
jgi:hypothetical protein